MGTGSDALRSGDYEAAWEEACRLIGEAEACLSPDATQLAAWRRDHIALAHALMEGAKQLREQDEMKIGVIPFSEPDEEPVPHGPVPLPMLPDFNKIAKPQPYTIKTERDRLPEGSPQWTGPKTTPGWQTLRDYGVISNADYYAMRNDDPCDLGKRNGGSCSRGGIGCPKDHLNG